MKITNQTDRIEARDAGLAGSVFEDVDLQDARFRDVSLARATFENVNLEGVRITDANLTGATIEGVQVSDLFAAWTAQNG